MKAMRFIFIFTLCTTGLPLASYGHTSDVSDPALATRRTHESKNHIGFRQANSLAFDEVSHEENAERFADIFRTSITKLVGGLRRFVARRRRTKIKTFDGAIPPSAEVKTIEDVHVAPAATVDHINSPPVLSDLEELTIPVGLQDDLRIIAYYAGKAEVPDELNDQIKAKARQLVLSLPIHRDPSQTDAERVKIYLHLRSLLDAHDLALMLGYAKHSHDSKALFNAGTIQVMQSAHFYHSEVKPDEYMRLLTNKFGVNEFVRDSYKTYKTLYMEWEQSIFMKRSIPAAELFNNQPIR
uniref:Uncharacterized protein n=1 Tax=Peronospora matthiolae TaxID=2874970 RepID=A0AAV1UX22_9STRA